MLKAAIGAVYRRARVVPTGGSATGILRAVAPQYAPDLAGIASPDATYVNVRGEAPFVIGSGDVSSIILSFQGWGNVAYAWANLPNSYSIVKAAIRNDAGTVFKTVTFSAGRTKTISPGDVDIQADAILPSDFSLSKFTRGERYWYRFEESVPLSTDLHAGGGQINTTTGGVAWNVIPSTVGVTAVDSATPMVASSGFSGTYDMPYVPTILGYFVSGDPLTLAGVGDSIMYGYNDTVTGKGVWGGFGRALFDADLVSNPIAGIDFGIFSAQADIWTAAAGAKPKALLKYCKWCVEQFGRNAFGSGANDPTNLTNTKARSQNIWAAAIAAGCSIARVKLIPATTGDNTTPLGVQWQAGGDARAFNDWIDTQVGAGGVSRVLNVGLQRISTDQATDGFYQWLPLSSTDWTHPNLVGSALSGQSYRALNAIINGASFTTPTLSSPSIGTGGPSGFTNATVSTTGATGLLYWAIVTNGGSCTDAQLKAGTGGNIVTAGYQTVTASGTNTVTSITGLSSGTTYQVKFLHTDAADNTSSQSSASGATSAPLYVQGVAFRATSGYVTDPTNYAYEIGTTNNYSHAAVSNPAGHGGTPSGNLIGWDSAGKAPDATYDLDSGTPSKTESGAVRFFGGIGYYRFNLPATGNYKIGLCGGDPRGGGGSAWLVKFTLYDNATPIGTPVSATATPGNVIDATGASLTLANWEANQAFQTINMTSTTLIVRFGDTLLDTLLNSLYVEQL